MRKQVKLGEYTLYTIPVSNDSEEITWLLQLKFARCLFSQLYIMVAWKDC
jgi:hypothetical protein